MKSFRLEIVTPKGKIFESSITKVFLRIESGDVAIMSGHIPMLATIRPCECRADLKDGKYESFMLDGGVLSVFKDRTIILANRL